VAERRDGRRGSLRLHQDALVFSAVLDVGHHLVHALPQGWIAWLHVVRSEVAFDGKGDEIRSNSSDWGLRYVCQLAGLRAFGWHVLRHTYASHLAMRGVSIQTIQEQLGHSGVARWLANPLE
jgi:integrase